jgi:hypothetical protein
MSWHLHMLYQFNMDMPLGPYKHFIPLFRDVYFLIISRFLLSIQSGLLCCRPSFPPPPPCLCLRCDPLDCLKNILVIPLFFEFVDQSLTFLPLADPYQEGWSIRSGFASFLLASVPVDSLAYFIIWYLSHFQDPGDEAVEKTVTKVYIT